MTGGTGLCARLPRRAETPAPLASDPLVLQFYLERFLEMLNTYRRRIMPVGATHASIYSNKIAFMRVTTGFLPLDGGSSRRRRQEPYGWRQQR